MLHWSCWISIDVWCDLNIVSNYTQIFHILKCEFDADLNPSEAEVVKQYPAHTAICIRDGWEFCSPELAAGMILLHGNFVCCLLLSLLTHFLRIAF